MTALARRMRGWNERIDAAGDVRALSVLRILLGPIVLLHLEDTFRLAADGLVYSDRFYLPYADWYPEAGPTLYVAMLVGASIAAIAMSVGLLTRWATAYSACFVGYNLFVSKTHFAHNRAFLLILLVTVAVLPVGRHYSVDAWLQRRRTGSSAVADLDAPLWAVWLVRFEVVAVYCASATSKIIDLDWWGGLMLQRRAIDQRAHAIDEGAPVWLMDLLADGTFQWWFSKTAVLTEYVIALGFLHRKTRLFAIWVAIPFHVSIQIAARVQVFSWAALAALVIWVTPRARTRLLVVPVGHWLIRVVPPLDWFGRFEIEQADVGVPELWEPADGPTRARHSGSDAIAATFLRLPATFWFVAPWRVVQLIRGGRGRDVPAMTSFADRPTIGS